jgi:FtsZ-binding cell division protein ZapB
MPDISHLGDFVSGQLRFGGAKNGVPVFVKHGRVRDVAEVLPPHDHAEVDAIAIPEEEEKIFVSMDMIRQEIGTLQEHDEVVQKYAQDLQQEVEHLQSELRQLKHRGSIDSGLGSRSGSDSERSPSRQFAAEKSREYQKFPFSYMQKLTMTKGLRPNWRLCRSA